jgi:uncharacterized protein (DUF2132 family)
MSDDTNYKSNPLHGLSLKNLLIEIVDHYGFEILYAYLNINCFKTNPSIDSSVKFLKKTDWAREKVESFYLYQFKGLPRASNDQFDLSPRDRVIPEGQFPGEPADLDLEDAARLQEKRARKAANHGSNNNSRNGSHDKNHSGRPPRSDSYSAPKRDTEHSAPSNSNDRNSGSSNNSNNDDDDPWAKWR